MNQPQIVEELRRLGLDRLATAVDLLDLVDEDDYYETPSHANPSDPLTKLSLSFVHEGKEFISGKMFPDHLRN